MQTKPLAGPASAEAIWVAPGNVPTVWPKVKHFIRRAMERGDMGRYDILREALFAGNACLWVVAINDELHAAAITQVDLTEKSKVCFIRACGGNGVNNWIGLLHVIETYARSMKCDCVRITGRKGWAKLLKGYTTEKVVLERRL